MVNRVSVKYFYVAAEESHSDGVLSNISDKQSGESSVCEVLNVDAGESRSDGVLSKRSDAVLSNVISKTDSILMDIADIFEATSVGTMPGDTCHNHIIPPDYGKYIITKVLHPSWEQLDLDQYSV